MPFETTRWSLVVAAGGDDPSAARTALAALCETYWYPLYAYVRRRGANADDARDLTQGFLTSLLERRDFSAVRRDLSRDGRLHWLTGRQSPTENWDAYEAPDGAALTAREPAPLEWPRLKSWLQDLANELTTSARDGSMPALRIDRLWLRRDGRLVLLDFAPPAAQRHDDADLEPTALLAGVAAQASGPSDAFTPYPLSARNLLNAWADHPPVSLDAANHELLAAAASADRVSRRRRMLPIALAAAPTTFMVTIALAVMLPTMDRFFGLEASEMLDLLEGVYQNGARPEGPWGDPALRDAAEVYLTGRHRARMIDPSFWNSPLMRQLKPRLEPVASRINSQRAAVSDEEITRASSMLEPRLVRLRSQRTAGWSQVTGITLTVPAAFLLLLTMVCALVSSAIAPGGLVTRLLGPAVIDVHGGEIGRWRSAARVGLAWLPGIVWLVYLAWSPKVQGFVPVPPSPLLGLTLTFVALAAGAAWTIARPNRGPHDRVAGTWVVPR